MTVDQKPLFQAAKKVGVGRVIPSDFGPTAPRGVMAMHDFVGLSFVRPLSTLTSLQKLDVREYVKDLGLPYTFVEVGWWLTSIFPYPHSTPETPLASKHYVGDRQQKLLVSTLESIGLFVARIVADPRTLNQTVIIYDAEVSLSETWALGAELSGEDFSDYPRVCSFKYIPLLSYVSNHVPYSVLTKRLSALCRARTRSKKYMGSTRIPCSCVEIIL